MAMTYPHLRPDGTFFVESDDSYRAQLNAREAARMIAKRKREVIVNELSRLAGEEYLEDIMQHMRHMEDETLPDANLIDMQREIQWFMRPYLIDFLVEAHAAFSLLPETLFLTINLLDRYCSKRVVYKQHYQLVGCSALLIAAKYGDKKDRVPQINELNNMCCGLYDAGMFTQMEMHVLNTLEWTVGHPTVDFFAQLIVAEERDDAEVEHMAAYISEIALYYRDFVSTKPSTMARASLTLARSILGRQEVNDGEWDLDQNNTLVMLSQTLQTQSASPILSRKYQSAQYNNVSSKLADFIARQNAYRRATLSPNPMTPTFAHSASKDIYRTPQKGLGSVPGAADGYMTPPITPEGAHNDPNIHNKRHYVPPRCPVTPTPQVMPQHSHAQHHCPPQQPTSHYNTYYNGRMR